MQNNLGFFPELYAASGGTWIAARRLTLKLLSFWVTVKTPPGGEELPPGDARVSVHEKRCFSYFLRYRNRRTLFLYRQALPFWFLGARRHNFSGSRTFRKTAFPGSLTVWFRWNFDMWSTTRSSSIWTMEILFGGQ